MQAPLIDAISVSDARDKLHDLETSVPGGISDFEKRAYAYGLSPREQGVWELITELRWLLGDE